MELRNRERGEKGGNKRKKEREHQSAGEKSGNKNCRDGRPRLFPRSPARVLLKAVARPLLSERLRPRGQCTVQRNLPASFLRAPVMTVILRSASPNRDRRVPETAVPFSAQ